jgi:hypothetical protein
MDCIVDDQLWTPQDWKARRACSPGGRNLPRRFCTGRSRGDDDRGTILALTARRRAYNAHKNSRADTPGGWRRPRRHPWRLEEAAPTPLAAGGGRALGGATPGTAHALIDVLWREIYLDSHTRRVWISRVGSISVESAWFARPVLVVKLDNLAGIRPHQIRRATSRAMKGRRDVCSKRMVRGRVECRGRS